MSISVNDAFGQAWLNCFDDVGRLIMGKTADEMQELKERSEQSGEGKEYDACFAEALCKTFVFRCRAKEDSFQDNVRIRYQVMSAAPVNYAQEAAGMVEQINLYGGVGLKKEETESYGCVGVKKEETGSYGFGGL